MRTTAVVLLSCVLLVTLAGAAFANDVEGRIESLNQEARSLVVQGIEFLATQTTEYDDGLYSFADLREGMRVEVEFIYRDGKHYAREISRDD